MVLGPSSGSGEKRKGTKRGDGKAGLGSGYIVGKVHWPTAPLFVNFHHQVRCERRFVIIEHLRVIMAITMSVELYK